MKEVHTMHDLNFLDHRSSTHEQDSYNFELIEKNVQKRKENYLNL